MKRRYAVCTCGIAEELTAGIGTLSAPAITTTPRTITGAYSGGVDGYLLWLPQVLSKYETTTHLTGNQLVEVDGDVAWAEHYACVFHRVAATPDGPAVDIVGNVRYVDRLERRGGGWRILKRTVIGDADHITTVDKTWFGEGLKRGARDASDPSYAV